MLLHSLKVFLAVATEKLTAGQFVRLESIRPPTRRERKAIQRAK